MGLRACAQRRRHNVDRSLGGGRGSWQWGCVKKKVGKIGVGLVAGSVVMWIMIGVEIS